MRQRLQAVPVNLAMRLLPKKHHLKHHLDKAKDQFLAPVRLRLRIAMELRQRRLT